MDQKIDTGHGFVLRTHVQLCQTNGVGGLSALSLQQVAHMLMYPSPHAGFATRGVVDGEERLVQLMIGPGPGDKLSKLLSGMATPLQ